MLPPQDPENQETWSQIIFKTWLLLACDFSYFSHSSIIKVHNCLKHKNDYNMAVSVGILMLKELKCRPSWLAERKNNSGANIWTTLMNKLEKSTWYDLVRYLLAVRISRHRTATSIDHINPVNRRPPIKPVCLQIKTKWDTITISLVWVIFQPHNYLDKWYFETLTEVANNCAPLLPKCFSISLQSLELKNSFIDLESCDTCKNLCPPKVRSRSSSSISDYSGKILHPILSSISFWTGGLMQGLKC